MLKRFARPAMAAAACIAMMSAAACSSGSIDSPTAPSLTASTLRSDAPPPPDPGPKGGCTPGFWKQPQHLDSWVGYAPGASFEATFGVDLESDMTLLQALGANGGGVNALARHAVAALLNSGALSFGMTADEVRDAVVAALADGGDIEGTKDAFAALNEAGCPLK